MRELVRQEGGDGRCLGQTESVSDAGIWKCLSDAAHQIRRNWRAAVHHPAHAFGVDVRKGRLVHCEPKYSGNGSERIYALGVNRIEKHLNVKRRHDYGGAAALA